MSRPLFPASSAPAFSFGATTPAFGAPAPSTPVFGATTAAPSMFGAGLFGASTPAQAPAFGQAAPAFGQATPAFGQPASAFGQAAPAFGQAPAASSIFGQPQQPAAAGMFGQPAASTALTLFGQPAAAPSPQQLQPQQQQAASRPFSYTTKFDDISPETQTVLQQIQ